MSETIIRGGDQRIGKTAVLAVGVDYAADESATVATARRGPDGTIAILRVVREPPGLARNRRAIEAWRRMDAAERRRWRDMLDVRNRVIDDVRAVRLARGLGPKD